MIIDATNLILGRLAAIVSKNALLGEKVHIVNCENAVITGTKGEILARYKEKRERGTFKGPLFYRKPSMFVRRAIRGMLPYKKGKGSDAFARIKCYQGVPENLKSKELKSFENIDVTKRECYRYLKIYDICKCMGEKV